MVFWYVLIFGSALVNARYCRQGFYSDYIGKEQGNAIKGVFIMLVFLAHALTEVKHCGFGFERPLDWAAQYFHLAMGQLIVAMFLFYSGYGVMTSLMTKGNGYLTTFPKKRILTTLLNFDVAVCVFLVVGLFLGRPVDWAKLPLSFVAWDNVGNSNWYVFVILCCYMLFYLVFLVTKNRYLPGALLVAAFSLVLMLVLRRVKGVTYWYSTVLVFPAGIFYALYSHSLEKVIQRYYWFVLPGLLVAFLFLHFVPLPLLRGVTFNVQAIIFALLIVVLTMKVRIGNKWLTWCGMSLFPLYIYQRLPMNVIRAVAGEAWICSNANLFFGVCFLLTVGIAWLYNRFLKISFQSGKALS